MIFTEHNMANMSRIMDAGSIVPKNPVQNTKIIKT
jgi:hypothetical protein